MTDPVAELIEILDLNHIGARTEEDIFTGIAQWMPHGRLFGGQVLAQALVAAQRTIGDERTVHSVHGYFLRAGDIKESITYSVDRIYDGRTFATRRTQAYQNGRPILSMIASFQHEEPGLEHQVTMPAGVPAPETLPTAAEVAANAENPAEVFWAKDHAFDVRRVPTPVYKNVDGEVIAHQALWIKSKAALPDDRHLHQAALAYLSDYSLLEPIIRRHNVSFAEKGVAAASLDHALWIHRYSRVDEWLLYVQESPTAQGGRGLALGRIYTRDGILVASVGQEGMIRVPRESLPQQ